MKAIPLDATARAVPRLGFLGAGWIGRMRMQALAASGAGCVAAIADTSSARVAEARTDAPDADTCGSLDDLLAQDLDGIVIATPSALHAEQSICALERGIAVFCQKPLARTGAETARVIAAARAADVLLGVDLSYRYTAAMRAVRDVVRSGSIGDVFAADLVFHNAYGPDRGWARDPALAGGGCVIDLGIHLIDLAFWTLGIPDRRADDADGITDQVGNDVARVHSQLYANGRRLGSARDVCEDFAMATIELKNGTVLRLACSWEVSAGTDAVIEVMFHGSSGGAGMRNVNGSFFDFTAGQYSGASTVTLATPPDAWPGRALVEWSARLARGERYDPAVEALVPVASTLDAVLGR